MFFRPGTFLPFLLLGAIRRVLIVEAQQSLSATSSCPTTWQCMPIKVADSPPVLDANHDDWKDVEAYNTKLVKALSGTVYLDGEDNNVASYKCLYDSENIYFALEIPGYYSFSTRDNHLCAAIATMFKVGKKATFVNMGGCPDALSGCDDGIPDTCDEYRVDIGAHWELKGTQQNTLYGVASSSSLRTSPNLQTQSRNGNTTSSVSSIIAGGDDPIASKDDEYGVSSYCRVDDNDAPNADNEWSGAWAYQEASQTNDGEELGRYHFELSRRLQTASLVSDAQLSIGETIQFGIAFWDPYEMPAGDGSSGGWTPAGHYVTGCGSNWINLQLEPISSTASEEGSPFDDHATVPGANMGAFPDEPNAEMNSSGVLSIRLWNSFHCFMVALVLACTSSCY